jgi:hypothetical protein
MKVKIDTKYEKSLDLRTIFVDKKGRNWNKVTIQELIDACELFHEFTGYVEHYF